MITHLFKYGSFCAVALLALSLGETAQAQWKLSFRSTQNGKYVRAGIGQDCQLAAISARASLSGWEGFEWIYSGVSDLYVLRATLSQQYVWVHPDNGTLYAKPSDNQLPGFTYGHYYFHLIPDYHGHFFLQSAATGKYVMADPQDGLRLKASATYLTMWNVFEWF